MLGNQLIDRNAATADVLPGRLGDRHPREEVGRLRIVTVAAMTVLLVETREDQDVVPQVSQGLQGGSQLIILSFRLRIPALLPHTVGKVDESRSNRRLVFRGGLRVSSRQGLQPWQGKGNSTTLQESATAYRLSN
jgi:hypothetical protein